MKTRNGFVSNSSSSSFVCDICHIAESGMDATASDFEMSICVNGHTFCNHHAENLPKPDLEVLRETVKCHIKNKIWLSDVRRNEEYQELEKVENSELEDYIEENYSDDGVLGYHCPICSMTVLRDDDGFDYLKKKLDIVNDDILKEIKSNFKSYTEFEKYIRPTE